MPNKKDLALAYLTHSGKFLDLAEKVFGEMVKQGNKNVIVGDGREFDQKDFWANYHEQTKWSDFNVIFPALFLFYHGIELMIKGLFLLLGSGIIGHKSDLLIKLKTQKGVKKEIIEITDNYLNFVKLEKSPLGDWLKKNNLNIDSLYERLRYPTDTTYTVLTDNFALKYKEEKMIPFVNKIIEDSKKLRILFVSQLNEIYPASER